MVEHGAYLSVLVIALGCLGLIDHRFSLALFDDMRRTILVLMMAVVLFLLWDIAGVQLDIFYVGDSSFLTGLRLLPQVPIEEVFFLLLLNYNALLLWRGGLRLWVRT